MFMDLIHGPVRLREGNSWWLLQYLILLVWRGFLLQNLNLNRYKKPSLLEELWINQLISFALVIKFAYFHNINDLGISLVNKNHLSYVLGNALADVFESVAFVL